MNWDTIVPITIFKSSSPKFKPLEVGENIQNLVLNNTKLVSKTDVDITGKNPSLKEIQENKPLTISFLSAGWNKYGLFHLNILQECYLEILNLGGELLVIVPAEYEEVMEMAQHFNLPFKLLADPTNQIAQQFGSYSEKVAIWNRLASITYDVAVPATYVIDKKGKIIYQSIDENFTNPFSPSEMLGAVFSAANNIPYSINYEVAA